jgi:hypothetical protein
MSGIFTVVRRSRLNTVDVRRGDNGINKELFPRFRLYIPEVFPRTRGIKNTIPTLLV